MNGQPTIEADAVNVAVEALEIGQAGQAEQSGRRHVVAGDRQAVLGAGDAAAGGVVVAGRLGALGRPVGNAQGRHHEDEEHHDGVDVERLFLGLADIRGGHGQPHPAQRQRDGGKFQHSAIHSMAPLMISALISSNSLLAR